MRGVVIDLDGTIIKSEIAIEKIFNKLLSKYNFLKCFAIINNLCLFFFIISMFFNFCKK